MANPGTQQLGDFGNKKRKIVNLGDGARVLPLSSFLSAGEEAAAAEAAAVVERYQDPLEVLSDGVMMIVLDKLDVRSIAVARVVNTEWLTVASADKLWAPRCVELWLGKAHIPRISKVQGISQMKATSLSIMDGKRTRITRNDMCDHAWDFHFSEAAPAYWRSLDPYWGATGAPMRRYFHHDGTITAGPDDKVWGGHESCFTVVTGLLADGKMREHYVRINRWPQMSVVRKPDWSWVLSNHLYCYSSIPDATDDDKVDGTGPYSQN
ncbi:hypothetical protein CASFOL_034994 [Castilleja foliolosa]|uniref:F-box domain-containing protein n=1 Tax=Castilleja foliolosa TaxID=1961234 RepID=A0ABD3BS48_9LAMI